MIISAIVIIIVVFNQFIIPRPIQKEFGIYPEAVDQIRIFDGTYGTSHVITEQKEINEFLKMFHGAFIIKSLDQRQMSGTILSASLYSKGTCVSSFSFGYYTVSSDKGRYLSSKNFNDTQISEIESEYDLIRK
ncbi:hypothetical protein [Caproiciproducens sp. LBM24188]